MPIPSKTGKDEPTFMKECVPQMINEGKSQDEAVAICMTEWKAENKTPEVDMKEKKPKGKLEILNDIKKMFEKNGMSIADEILLAMFEKIDVNKTFSQKIQTIKLNATVDKQIIKVFPKKKVFIEKYNQVIDFDDKLFDEMINNFQNEKLFKPFIDKDHELREKFGEIIHLFKQDDGLYAEIQLNDLGVDAIKNNKYSYISPEWGSRINTEKQVCKNVLWAITLTNIPALEGELPTLQEQIKLKKGVNMDIDKRLSEMKLTYKLQNADPAAVVGLVEELFKMLDEMKAKFAEMMGAKEGAEQQAQEAKAELSKIREQKRLDDKKAFFSKAVEEGRVEPKELDKFEKLFDSNEEIVKSLVLSREVKNDIQLSKNTFSQSSDLDDIDYAIMAERGLSKTNPEHIALYKKAQGVK